MLKDDRRREWFSLVPRHCICESGYITCGSEGQFQGGGAFCRCPDLVRQGVDRLDDRRARRGRKGGSRAASAADTREGRKPCSFRGRHPCGHLILAVVGLRRLCTRCMIPLESPVPEIGTPGSGSGGWKRNHGSRTEDRSESNGYATGPYRRRASPRLYPGRGDHEVTRRPPRVSRGLREATMQPPPVPAWAAGRDVDLS